jgi:hypothetical protein
LIKVHEELSPCDIVLADVENTTSDARVNEFLTLCKEIETA